VGGLVLFALGSAASFAAPSYAFLVGGRVVTGMGASLLSLNTITYAADFFPYNIRGWAMGSIFSSYFAALILGVPLASAGAERFGWQRVFAITGILGAALSVFALGLPGAVCSDSPRGASAEPSLRRYRAFLSTRRTLGALLAALSASAGMMGFLAFVGIWLHDAFGASTRSIGLVFLGSGVAALVASPVAGALSDRIGKRTQFVLANVVLAVLVVALPGVAWGIPLYLLFCAISLAAAFRQGPMEALLTEVAPAGSRATFVALKNSFSQLGIAGVALASGHLFERAGYASVCLLSALLNLAAAASMSLIVKERNL
jgi:predicted MFS family arabinose efflux permease